MTAPSRATIAGQAYLDLRRRARQDRRPVDELIQLYVLEGFLARLAQTAFAERFMLKGGMLLAALGERRPTRDIDLQASTTSSDTGTMLAAVRQIAGTPRRPCRGGYGHEASLAARQGRFGGGRGWRGWRGRGNLSLAERGDSMFWRLQFGAALTAGLLAATACGSQPAGGSAARPVSRAWLDGVTATSGDDAWAVGSFRHANDDLPLIEHWDGRRWTVMRPGMHLQAYADYILAGAAATSATNAWAAGSLSTQYGFALIDHWDGAGWKPAPTPTAGCCYSAAGLAGVAAASPANAWAVGDEYVGASIGDDRTLILRWNARAGAWVKVPSPNPAGRGGAAQSALDGVAVLSPADAWAVGVARSGPSGQRDTLIEKWDGTSWTVVPSPGPSRAGCVNDELLGVAATHAAAWTVGDYCGAALVLRLHDGRWQQVPAPGPPAGTSERLASVAVTSATDAWAAGSIGDRILILRWNGTKWVTAPAPSPPGATSAQLASITAVSPSIAWAVGQADYPHHVTSLLIERWNGTRWAIVPVPNPAP